MEASVGEQAAGPQGEDDVMFLVDPAFLATEEQPSPPVKALIGAWLVDENGNRSRFQPNPLYEPGSPDSPLDPVDALLRGLADDGGLADHLPVALRDAMLGIAVEENGTALVRQAPDGVPSVLVTTSFGHRRNLVVPQWLDVTIEELAEALPSEGVDVLLNPGAAASMRLLADAVRDAARGSDIARD
ncbi:type VII secretion system-associated protein [Amycolatopsis pigmentata]|uniref:Type VII secretion system-associated protein n=1 Tax=Amycolatopsis pigmentata TaxID=450801 RepID=A0ABW5FYF4_9PSEU